MFVISAAGTFLLSLHSLFAKTPLLFVILFQYVILAGIYYISYFRQIKRANEMIKELQCGKKKK